MALIFWCKVDYCFPIKSYVLPKFIWRSRPSISLFNRTIIIHMKTSVSHRLNILCIMFKIIAFFKTTLLTQQYVKVDNILVYMEKTWKRGQKQKHHFCTVEPLVWKHAKSIPSFILHQESLHNKFIRTTDERQRQTYKIHDQRQTNIIQLQNCCGCIKTRLDYYI